MSHQTKRLGYSDKLGADEQISMEEMIAFAIREGNTAGMSDEAIEEGLDVVDPYPEETCQILSREILYNVLRKFRPDLFEQELSCYNCDWKGFESEMTKTVKKGNVPDLYERTDNGGDSAVGECPKCGALIEED